MIPLLFPKCNYKLIFSFILAWPNVLKSFWTFNWRTIKRLSYVSLVASTNNKPVSQGGSTLLNISHDVYIHGFTNVDSWRFHTYSIFGIHSKKEIPDTFYNLGNYAKYVETTKEIHGSDFIWLTKLPDFSSMFFMFYFPPFSEWVLKLLFQYYLIFSEHKMVLNSLTY